MTQGFGNWVIPLTGEEVPDAGLIGGKARSIARMSALGLSVPPGFVVTTKACIRYLEEDRMPPGLEEEIARGIAWLEKQTGRTFGAGPRPLLVSVRSGAAISMPGMMDTVLNLGITPETEAALAKEFRDPVFARNVHRRFFDLYAGIVLKAAGLELSEADGAAVWSRQVRELTGAAPPESTQDRLLEAVRAVFDSWNSRRARRYRDHHDIPHDLGTAVTVQAMVFGNLDDASGTGVVFSRNPLSGAPEPFGEFLPRAQGEDVVSGTRTPQPLSAMKACAPGALDSLLQACRLLEEANGDVQDIEFTVQGGRLFLLQTRTAHRSPKAAVRIAVDLVNEGLIPPAQALLRVTPEHVRVLLRPRLAGDAAANAAVLVRGEGASPGVGTGLVVTDTDEADRRGHAGEDIVLARPTTSPEDVHGMIAAHAILTEKGGATSHAAVVGRALGRPCVVGCGEGTLGNLAGRMVTVDGQNGVVYEGRLAVVTPEEADDPLLSQLAAWAEEHAGVRVEATVPRDVEPVDLDTLPGGEDPSHLEQLFRSLPRGAAVKGALLAGDDAVRAAIGAGVSLIIVEPRLPALLLAARSALSERG